MNNLRRGLVAGILLACVMTACGTDVPRVKLGDEIKDGDHFVAFIYKDLETWSDTYAAFLCGDNP